MNEENQEGAATPNDQPTEPVEQKLNVPNNFDHLVMSGLCEGSFTGPFDMEFEGNHTLVVGSSGMVAIYRASRTSPVAFIAKGAEINISSGDVDSDVVITAKGPGAEMEVVFQDLAGISAVPVDGKWLSIEKGILEAVHDLDGKYGRRRLGRILSGACTLSTVTGNLQNLKLFGRFKRCSASEIVENIDSLVEAGFLEVDTNSNFPTIGITEKGHKKMVSLRTELGVVDLAFGDPEATEDTKAISDALRAWRVKQSKDDDVPFTKVFRIPGKQREIKTGILQLATFTFLLDGIKMKLN